MSVQTDPLPPAPDHTPPMREDEVTRSPGRFFNPVWTRWFISLRDKVNALSTSLVNLGDVAGAGIVVKDGDQWTARTITGNAGRIAIFQGNGIAGNPNVDLVTVVAPGSYSLASITIDAWGRVIAASSGTLPPPPVGIPSGGTTGQVLMKNSNADYDVSWTTLPP